MPAIILQSYDILSPEFGKSYSVDLAEGLDEGHLDHIEDSWGPLLERQYALALLEYFELADDEQTPSRLKEICGRLGVQDYRWDWRIKNAVAPKSRRRIFSMLNVDQVEAAMLLLFGEMSRDPASSSLEIVYVDFLAVAPWNRREFQHPQRFNGLGRLMIGAAVAMSLIAGHDGRCGLHSLPQAEGFYRRIGMTDFGPDSKKESLRYFEFSAQTAQEFIK